MEDRLILREYALKQSMTLVFDVFHGASGYELRKPMNDGIFCIGAIINGPYVEIYTRKVKLIDIYLHEKWWMLGNILHIFGYNVNSNYQCVKRVNNNMYDVSMFTAFVNDELMKIEMDPKNRTGS